MSAVAQDLAHLSAIRDLADRQIALRLYLDEARGCDLVGRRLLPRALVGDVVQLAGMWDSAVVRAPRAALAVFGVRGAVRAWLAYRDRLEALVRPLDEDDVYPDGRGFWDVTTRLALRLQIGVEEVHADPVTRIVFRNANGGATVTESSDGHVTVTGSKDLVDSWVALKGYLADRRGFDLFGKSQKIPRTTVADAVGLKAIWGPVAARDIEGFGVPGAKARWAKTSERIAQLAKAGDVAAIYPDNTELWRASNQLAIRLQVAGEEPGDVSFIDALSDNIVKLPSRIKDAGSWLAGETKDAVGGATRVVGSGLSNALGPMLKPLAIGAGVLGGALLVTKLIEHRRARRAG